MTTVRKLTQYVPLKREEFRERFFERFYDPAFDKVRAELEKVFDRPALNFPTRRSPGPWNGCRRARRSAKHRRNNATRRRRRAS